MEKGEINWGEMYCQGLKGKYVKKVLWNTEDKQTDWISINNQKWHAIPFSITQHVIIKAFQLKTPALICREPCVNEFWSHSNLVVMSMLASSKAQEKIHTVKHLRLYAQVYEFLSVFLWTSVVVQSDQMAWKLPTMLDHIFQFMLHVKRIHFMLSEVAPWCESKHG